MQMRKRKANHSRLTDRPADSPLGWRDAVGSGQKTYGLDTLSGGLEMLRDSYRGWETSPVKFKGKPRSNEFIRLHPLSMYGS